jgi:exodeoxyribonuclease-3
MKLATWNVNSLGVRLPQVLDWLAVQAADGAPVDVLALQELKLTDDKFPFDALAAAGYHAVSLGQKTYNGVALLSRTPAHDVVKNIPHFEDAQARVLCATIDGIRVIGAYFPNGQAPGSEKFAYKMRWLAALEAWVAAQLRQHAQLVLMGDFNITFDDADVWDAEGLRDTIHCTAEERAHLQALTDLGLHDALRLFAQAPKTYTWWDYRDLAFRRNRGLRIDHVLVSEALKVRAQACQVDRAPRKNERPSDHTPVVLTLVEHKSVRSA